MFTGIVQRVGRVLSLREAREGARLEIDPGPGWDDVKTGESVAHDGVCLTVEPDSAPHRLTYFLSAETLARTSLRDLRPGSAVNLERSLAVGDRIGGHFVMGHVDAVGQIARLDSLGEGWHLEVEYPPAMRPFLAPKGSISVDGISLTLVEVRPTTFTVALIPHTYRETSLREKRAGAAVNLEADTIARHVAEHLARLAPQSGLDLGKLREAGFASE